MKVDRANFDDLVTLVTQAPTWEKDRVQGVRTLLRALGDKKADAPEQILARWTWRLARATRKVQDRRASAEFPEAKRLLGALANSSGHRHEENAAKLVNAALAQPREVGAALLASAEGYTPRANKLIDAARERLGTIQEVANALADNLPAPKAARPLPPQAPQAQEEGPGAGPGTAAAAGAERAEARGAENRSPKPLRPPRRNAWCRHETVPGHGGRLICSRSPSSQASSQRSRRAPSPCCRSCSRAARPAGAPAVRDRRRARHDLPPSRCSPPGSSTAPAAAGPPAQHLDRAALPRRGDADRPELGTWLERPLARLSRRSPGSDLGGGFLLGASLGLVFVPCGGAVIGAISANAARVHLGWPTVAITLAYALGAALPMLAIALSASERRAASARTLSRSGPASASCWRWPRSRSSSTRDTKLQTWFPDYTHALQGAERSRSPATSSRSSSTAGPRASRPSRPRTSSPTTAPRPTSRASPSGSTRSR